MLYKKINYLLNEKKISIDNFAKYLGCSYQAVYNWCKGERRPDYETLVKIANYFDVSTDYLLGNNKIKSEKEEWLFERDALINALVKAGYMKDDEDLSDEELKVIMKFIEHNKDFIKAIVK